MEIINRTDISLSPHPGLILKGELDEHGLSQRELASALGKSAPMINGILSGSKDITVEIAILLEAALPGSLKAQDWLRLQNEHDLEAKRLESSVKDRTAAIHIWNFLREHSNFNALRRRLNFNTDFESNITTVMNALGVSTIKELESKLNTSSVGFKKSDKVQTDQTNLFSWIIIVKHVSRSSELATPFDKSSITELIPKLNRVFYDNVSVIERTGKLLNEYGIKFISDEKRLEKVPVDGYSFWMGDNPTIVTTQRMNRIDNFAFTIMHELGHINLHLEKNGTNEFIDVDHAIMHVNEQEDEANQFATHALWEGESPEPLFADIENPYASAKALNNISKRKRINVGIVTGQYQFFCNQRGIVKNSYTICRDLINKIG